MMMLLYKTTSMNILPKRLYRNPFIIEMQEVEGMLLYSILKKSALWIEETCFCGRDTKRKQRIHIWEKKILKLNQEYTVGPSTKKKSQVQDWFVKTAMHVAAYRINANKK